MTRSRPGFRGSRLRALLQCAVVLAVAAGCSDDSTGPGAAGPAAPDQSEVNASVSTVTSGASVMLTLQAKDAQGRVLSRGGSTVTFHASGGGSTGIISATTDRGNGSYEATFTGVLAGNATTIGATLDGAPVTSPLPVIRVRPGTFSPMTSTVTVTPRTVLPGGKATLELITRDAAGNALETGGLDVELHVSGGSAVGIVGEVTDHGNGRYTAPFTATQIGTPLGVSAEVEGSPIATPPPTLAVARGISLDRSVLSVTYDTLSVNSGMRITMALRDSSDVARVSGGDTVQFSVTGGAGGGDATLSDFTDHDDGTYTANLIATQAGSITIGVRVNGRSRNAPPPTVMIVASPVTAQNSTVTASVEIMAAGDTAVLTAQLRDLNGALVTAGDLPVKFTLSVDGNAVDGASGGEIGPTQNEGLGIYSATLIAQRAGTPITIGATIGDTTQIQMLDSLGNSHLPKITVLPGAASADSSLLTAEPPRIDVGDSATVRLIARDAFGNPLLEGGHDVKFQREGGAGVSFGRLRPVIDHDDGTYTAWYVGDSTGTPDVIHATLDGHAITTQLPSIAVGPACSPGPVSLSVSDLTINDTTKARLPSKAITLPSGVTTTVTLRISDNKTCPVVEPHAVVISAAGGTSTGVFGAMVNLEDGRHIVTYTGDKAGTVTALIASIDGAPVTSLPVAVTVVPGDISTSKSMLSTSRSTVAAGDSAVLTLVAYDAAGNRITKGGRLVTFMVAGDDPGGVFRATKDRGDGTYEAVYVGTTANVTDTILAVIEGTPVLQRVTISVSP